jgi:hypothetical protein
MEKFCLEAIYSRLEDEESRSIFEKRLCYSLTGDKQRMIDAINPINKESIAYKTLQKTDKELFIFGAKTLGHAIVVNNPEIHWKAFVDNDISKVGNADILPIISLDIMNFGTQKQYYMQCRIK